jgi:hypothetical protein
MNWGTKIIIGMSIFIVFIVAMGAKMIMSNENDALVEKDYYEKGLSYSEEYDKKVNAARDGVIPSINVSKDGMSVAFTGKAKYRIDCKYVSDSKSDKVFKGEASPDNKAIIGREQFRPGAWRVNIEFTSNSQEYQFEQEVMMP